MSQVGGRAWLAHDGETPGYRRMTMSAALTLKKAMAGGANRTALARELGVSRRTLYRWRGATFHRIEIEGWEATFVIRPHRAESNGATYPIQITPWIAREASS